MFDKCYVITYNAFILWHQEEDQKETTMNTHVNALMNIAHCCTVLSLEGYV